MMRVTGERLNVWIMILFSNFTCASAAQLQPCKSNVRANTLNSHEIFFNITLHPKTVQGSPIIVFCCEVVSVDFIHTLQDYFTSNGPLARYVTLRVAHAPGMPGTFPPPPISKETASKRSRHATRYVRSACAVMHVEIVDPRWRGKRSRHPGACATRNFTYLSRGPWVNHVLVPVPVKQPWRTWVSG